MVHLRVWFYNLLKHPGSPTGIPAEVYQIFSENAISGKALRGLDLSFPVLQVHILSPAEYLCALARQRELGVRYLDEHLLISRRLIRKLEKSTFPCRIITLTREPISRAISFVFQTMRTRTPDVLRTDGQIDREKALAKVVDILQGDHPAADPGKWFDKELRAVFGVDVFCRPYEFDQGYVVFHDANNPVLLIRMEDLDRHLPSALGDFLGVTIPSSALRPANIGKQKWYADDISWVKKNLRLSQETLIRLVSTKYFQHFYSQERDIVVRRYGTTPLGDVSDRW